jgi:hypothetical protein
MNDETLAELLKQTDERFQTVGSPETAASANGAAFIDAVHRGRARLVQQRTALGVLAVLFLAGGISAWGLNIGLKSRTDHLADVTNQRASDAQGKTTDAPVARPKLNDEDIARLKAEIAALDAEANRVRQFVELYRAAEDRHERLAAANMALKEPLLPPQVLAELQIDRAAAITVLSADLQANTFERRDKATDAYRSVLKHFPNSRWASIAEQRLAQVQHMN